MPLNPYFDVSFFSFFPLFFSRIFAFATGQLSVQQLAPDELQIMVLIGLAISSSLLGTLLILRKMTMLANSLSHTILLGIVGAFLYGGATSGEYPSTGPLLVGAVIAGSITALLTQSITHTGVQEDASTGLVFTALFALGVTLVTLLTRNLHLGIEAVMGNVDMLSWDDVTLMSGVVVLNGVVLLACFKEYLVTTFDPRFAKAIGLRPSAWDALLMVLVSVTLMVSFRAVGVILVLTFLTAPAILSRLFARSVLAMVVGAAVAGIVNVLVGVALTRHLLNAEGIALSTSAVVGTLLFFSVLAGLLWTRRAQH